MTRQIDACPPSKPRTAGVHRPCCCPRLQSEQGCPSLPLNTERWAAPHKCSSPRTPSVAQSVPRAEEMASFGEAGICHSWWPQLCLRPGHRVGHRRVSEPAGRMKTGPSHVRQGKNGPLLVPPEAGPPGAGGGAANVTPRTASCPRRGDTTPTAKGKRETKPRAVWHRVVQRHEMQSAFRPLWLRVP